MGASARAATTRGPTSPSPRDGPGKQGFPNLILSRSETGTEQCRAVALGKSRERATRFEPADRRTQAPEPSPPVGAGDWETTDGTGRFGQAARSQTKRETSTTAVRAPPMAADTRPLLSSVLRMYGQALGPDWPLRRRACFASASGSAPGPGPRC